MAQVGITGKSLAQASAGPGVSTNKVQQPFQVRWTLPKTNQSRLRLWRIELANIQLASLLF